MGSEEGNDSQEPGIIVLLTPPIFVVEQNKQLVGYLDTPSPFPLMKRKILPLLST
jgi:type IV secretory pathway protease TraF